MGDGGWSNDSVTTLVVPTGATTGERIVIDGPTGTIQVYDATNTLIASVSPIDQTVGGILLPHGFGSYDHIGGGVQTTVVNQAHVAFTDTRLTGTAPQLAPFTQSDAGTFYPGIALASGSAAGWPSFADVLVVAGDPVTSGQSAVALIQGTTGSATATGQAMATDTDPTAVATGRQPWRRHTERYTAVVAGATGLATFAHNAATLPVAGQFTPLTGFTQGNWVDAFGTHGFTATQAQVQCYTPAGAFVANGTTVTLYAEFAL